MLNEGDLVFIKQNIHIWQMVEMEGKNPVKIYNSTASILYPHSTKEGWYYVFLHKPVKKPFVYRESNLIWTGWVYLSEERWEEGLFDVCV